MASPDAAVAGHVAAASRPRVPALDLASSRRHRRADIEASATVPPEAQGWYIERGTRPPQGTRGRAGRGGLGGGGRRGLDLDFPLFKFWSLLKHRCG